MNHARRLALSLILAAPLAAQEEIVSAAEVVKPQTFSLEFPGGSLSDLIDAIRRAADGANIVASALASEVELPAIMLRNATVQASLMSVRMIAPEHYRVSVETQVDSGTPVHSVTVTGTQNPQLNQPHQDYRGVRVFSIRSLIEALPSDPPGFADKLLSAATVLSAVENGLEVSRPASHGEVRVEGKAPWDLRYHEDSKLLFVSAHPDQLVLVQEVLQALEQDVQQARTASLRSTANTQTGGKDH